MEKRIQIHPLQDAWVQATKELIAETVLEFYSDLAWLPRTKTELLQYYHKVGYLKDLDEYQTVYHPDAGSFLVLMEGEALIGCGGLRQLNTDAAELSRLWLKKEKRNQGLGYMLLERLIKVAMTKGYSKIFLDTSRRCAEAVALFKRNGFSECAPYKESIGDVFMCRTL